MDDVIFAGTAKRPALGRAEVTLTIDNSAGLLPIDFTEVTITRTLFRTGDSEYAINGVPCRLLDIQELLSDTGVGRQQHVIVSQGQIDAVLNARPEERRLIIEEAAGVLKYRKRKEKAERRLAATEGNLTRLGDLLREVRRQLRPLERQADAARRHGDLVAELRALHLFLAGRELTTLRRRLSDGGAARAELATEDNLLRRTLAELDAGVVAAEAELGHTGGDDLGDALVRFESLREKARGLVAVLTERRRGIDRERGAFVDQAVIATLEAEASRLASELADADAEADALVPRQGSWPRRRPRSPTPAPPSSATGPTACPPPPAGPPRGAVSWPPSARAWSAARRSWSGPRPGRPRWRRSWVASKRKRAASGPRRRPPRRPRARWLSGWPPPSSSGPPPSSRWPRRRPSSAPPTATATPGRHAARRSAWPSTRPAPALAPSGWRRSRAWWARCSTWSTSTPAGSPRWRRPPARRWPPWWSTASMRRAAIAALHADADDAIGGAVLALGANRSSHRAPPWVSRSGRTSGRRGRTWRRCSMPSSAGPWPWRGLVGRGRRRAGPP